MTAGSRGKLRLRPPDGPDQRPDAFSVGNAPCDRRPWLADPRWFVILTALLVVLGLLWGHFNSGYRSMHRDTFVPVQAERGLRY